MTQASTLLVRAFSEGDVAPANALTNHYIVHTPIHFGLEPSTDEAFRALWEKGRARFPWLAAEVRGVFAGYCKAGTWRERAAYERTVETGVYVEERCRGRGVGLALYGALFEALREGGFHAVVAGITLPNEASVRLHERAGFSPVGVFREVGRKFDQWHDVGFWQRGL
ncbi:MAG: N-acetyltransferase family protein [Deltaproteobacteria bacterium]|nr:N-acetyltransferase family protein [Deltaproteobacteria bacterium]